MKTPRTIIC